MIDFLQFVWGEGWSDPIRWISLFMGILFAGLPVLLVWSWIGDRRFVASCYARGGHVHYKHRRGPSVLVGTVIVPTTDTTMYYAPGPKSKCRRCN